MYKENFIGRITFFHRSSISTCYIAFMDDSNEKVHIGYLRGNKNFIYYLEICLECKFPCDLLSINKSLNIFSVILQNHKIVKLECLTKNIIYINY